MVVICPAAPMPTSKWRAISGSTPATTKLSVPSANIPMDRTRRRRSMMFLRCCTARSAARRHRPGGGHGGIEASFGVCREQRRLEADLFDVRDVGLVEPVAEIGRMVVDAEGR